MSLLYHNVTIIKKEKELLRALLIQYMMYVHTHTDCSIRKSADQFILADPRSLSQLITSFVGS